VRPAFLTLTEGINDVTQVKSAHVFNERKTKKTEEKIVASLSQYFF
jgi:hypothetical protein